MLRAACIGECMIEIREGADGSVSRSYGGDTLNTAVYLARLGISVDYITALGDDPWSDEMIAGWRGEGVGTDRVVRLPGRLPGLYIIRTDTAGERSFSYWRENAPARQLFELPETPALTEAMLGYDLLYLSGITLSLYGEAGRQRLFDTLDRARLRGCKIAFDMNYRPRGWLDRSAAWAAYQSALDRTDIVLASTEDVELLCGGTAISQLIGDSQAGEIVRKLPDLSCQVLSQGQDVVVKAEPVDQVVDTTAAGDSFAAAYLAARLTGADLAEAAAAGHRLAGIVVGYSGAIIARQAMTAMCGVSSFQLQENR
jgi:2-dehydro-3-deoxygluconokinase